MLEAVAQAAALDAAMRDEPDGPAPAEVIVEGVTLSLECSLRTLRAACTALGLGRSGSKQKVFDRIKDHLKRQDVLQRFQIQEQQRRDASREAGEIPRVAEPDRGCFAEAYVDAPAL